LLAKHRECAPGTIADADLLSRFATTRDEAAFELLVWRHGAMVLGVCQRVLRDAQLAEDAFQAVFLVLARKSHAVRGNVGGWLFTIAQRIAKRAAAKRVPLIAVPDVPVQCDTADAERSELAQILDAEIARLPARLRNAVVLCYLHGHSTEHAANQLGCPRGTILSRLAAARKRLARRLRARGITLPATLVFATTLQPQTVLATVAAAKTFGTAAATHSLSTILAEGALRTMTRATLLSSVGGILIAALAVTGVGVLTAQPGTQPTTATANVNTESPAVAAKDTRDYGDEAKPQPPQPPKPPTNNTDTKDKRLKEDHLAQVLRMMDAIRTEIDLTEKACDLLVRQAGLTSAASIDGMQRQIENCELELARVQNDLIQRNAQLAALQKRLDGKKPLVEVEAALLRQTANRDPRVVAAMDRLAIAKSELTKLMLRHETPAELLKAVKGQVEALTAELERTFLQARDDAQELMLATERHELKKQIATLTTEIEVLTQVHDRLKRASETKVKQLENVTAGTNSVASMKRSIAAKQETLKKLEWLRIQMQLPKTATGALDAEAKLDLLLQTIAELKKEVQELKQKK
jgi:RNA polymerase sigma factor (sigma-70 family)